MTTPAAAPTAVGSAEPGWLRLFSVVDRAYHALGVVREELALSRIGAARLEAIVAERYGRTSGLYADPDYLEGGLFDWEQAAVERHFPPPPARLLVGGAGCGRELFALARMGFEPWGFEPSEALHAQLAASARARGLLAPIARGGYRELVDGGLDGIARGAPFGAVLLGWASVSHIAPARVRAALLPCLRRLAPRAPVLLSFSPANALEPGGAAERLRRHLRRALSRLPGAQPVAPGDSFGAYGFEHSYAEAELRELAKAAGYEVAHLVAQVRDYPHAVLVAKAPAAAP